jgi:hypothetical protein
VKTKINDRSLKGAAFALFAVSVLALTAPVQAAAETNRTLFAEPESLSNAANYTFATTTSGTFTDMNSGTTQLVGPGTNDSASVVTNLPFDFYMLGTRYTQFSVSSNGYIRLGGTAVSPTQYALGTANIPLVTALGSDLEISDRGGKVHFKVTGTTPNRVLTVEFLNMTIINDGPGTGSDGTYQVRLYETTGVIEFVYGAMNRNTSTTFSMNPQYIGLSIDSTTNNFATVDAANTVNTTGTPTGNQFPLGAPMASLNSPVEGSRRTYTFTPPIPTPPTNLMFTDVTAHAMALNWVDSPNEQFYEIYRSTDGLNYSFITTRSQNSTAFQALNLASSTNYFWRVYAVSDGGVSTPLSGSQMTTAPGTVIVTNLNDSGAGSLRQALIDAEDGGTVAFNIPSPPGGDSTTSVFTITLTSGQLTIAKNLTISGPGANVLTVERSAAAPAFRIFLVNPGRTVTIEGLTISNGFADGPFGLDKVGGGIHNHHSILTVNSCLLIGNRAAAFSSGGGGIYNNGSAGYNLTATLTVANTTLSGNSATNGYGGGISNDGINGGSATLTVVNSTLSGNLASQSGGGAGIDNNGGSSIVTVLNSTLSGNSGAANIVNVSNVMRIGNTILEKGGSPANIINFTAAVTSLGYNLSDDATGPNGFQSDQVNTDPILGPLKNNGGPTPTYAPLSNSPAIDRGKDLGPNGDPTGQDQRGSARPVTYDAAITPPAGGDRSDIGAVELPPGVLPIGAVSRKTHGAAGYFDINLPLTGPVGIECRSGGATNDYEVVVTFASPVTFSSAAVNDGSGSVAGSSGSGTNTVTVDLTGVANVQRITLALFDVDNDVNSGDVGVRMGMLIGDTNGSGSVNAGDVSVVKGLSGLPVSGSNFRADVTANGAINSADVNLVKSKAGTSLPP